MKIGETISRVRNVIKAVKEDAFMTNRFLYSLISKHGLALMYIQNEIDLLKTFYKLFKPLTCVELIEVDKIEACCTGIRTGCTIMRTKEKIPEPVKGRSGILIRNVTSLDGEIQIDRIDPRTYVSMTKSSSFKYSKRKYYWYLDGHLYFPNLQWEGVRLEGVWEDDVTGVNCSDDAEEQECMPVEEQECFIPDELFSQVESQVLQELGFTLQVPPEDGDNKQSVQR